MITPIATPPSLPHRTIAFTTPNNYATRLATVIARHRNWTPLWCPPSSSSPPPPPLHPPPPHLLSQPLLRRRIHLPLRHLRLLCRPPRPQFPSSLPNRRPLFISALGNDAEEITAEFVGRICRNPDGVEVRVPRVSTPSGIVELLGDGLGRRVMCPVPVVLGLEEPRVVPEFLKDLGLMGWEAVKVGAYETRWAGPKCAERLVNGGVVVVDVLVFTSTAEVEGLLKGLREIGLGWDGLRRMWPGLVVAAHGPVTALGAERLGVKVDAVSSRFGSFDGVVNALALAWESSSGS